MVKAFFTVDKNRKLSTHFTVSEFWCKGGGNYCLIDTTLIWILERTRAYFNKPITITSGYRTESYNETVGGATDSQHLYGRAADIVVQGVSATKVQEYLETVYPDMLGIGKATSYTHIDTRATKVRWTY